MIPYLDRDSTREPHQVPCARISETAGNHHHNEGCTGYSTPPDIRQGEPVIRQILYPIRP